jgi:tripartite-type tricarboxylate transporter receptor subunit TctC
VVIMSKMKVALWAMVFVFISVFSSFASEPFPSRPIEIIVPFDPGGGMDLMARTLAPKMSEILGQPVVVINKPGSAGTVGTALASKRKPDGYTLVTISASPIFFSPHLYKLEYDPLKDITYIAGLLSQPQGIQVLADAPWKTFQDLLNDAKSNPGKIKYGSLGINSTGHVFMECIAKDRGITWTHVPFKGDGTLTPAILGGHVMVAVGIGAAWVPHAKAGRLRPLTLFTERRFSDFPDVPTLNEFGFNYYLGVASLNGIGAPKGLPDEILRKLEDAIRQAADSPQFKEGAKTVSHDLYFQNSKDFTRSVEKGFHSIGDMIKRVGIKE